jgi:hypothetical protein
VIDLDVREPKGTPGAALDDPGTDPATELECEIGARGSPDQLRAPSSETRIERGRRFPITGVELEVNDGSRLRRTLDISMTLSELENHRYSPKKR